MRNDQGTIRKALSGFYYVQTDDGLVTCRARGKFRYQKITPLVGGLWADYAHTTLSASGLDVGLPEGQMGCL